MGGGSRWSPVEETVLLYFNSIGVQHEACAALITLKCDRPRNVIGVRHKLKDLRKKYPSLWDVNTQKWNLDAVDKWLLDQDILNLQRFLSLDQEEEKRVVKVRLMSQHLMFSTCLQY